MLLACTTNLSKQVSNTRLHYWLPSTWNHNNPHWNTHSSTLAPRGAAAEATRVCDPSSVCPCTRTTATMQHSTPTHTSSCVITWSASQWPRFWRNSTGKSRRACLRRLCLHGSFTAIKYRRSVLCGPQNIIVEDFDPAWRGDSWGSTTIKIGSTVIEENVTIRPVTNFTRGIRCSYDDRDNVYRREFVVEAASIGSNIVVGRTAS